MARDAKIVEREFLALYDESADSVFRHCVFRVSDRELAKDMTQETFARTWEYLARGKTLTSPKAFVFRTANNLIIDHYRRKKAVSLEVLSEHGFDPVGDDEAQVMAKAEGREVIEAIKHLEDDHKQVIVLRYVNDLPINEIAEILGESENTVSVRTHRAVHKLKELLTYGRP
jgi:RNA polymerase sigma-70 factor, ECF subfamily